MAELRGSKRGPRRHSDRESSRRSSLVLFALLSATLIVVGSSSPFQGVRGALSGLFAPFRAVGNTVAEPFTGLSDAVTDRNRLRRENEALREQLADAQGRVAVADDALRERRDLLAMNDLDSITGLRSVRARVLAWPLDNFDSTIEIDRGSDDGVQVGMPVASGLGLVGSVTVVTPQAARVRLFTDPDSQVGVRHATSGEVGVIRGQGSNKPMPVELFDPATPVAPGDVLVTAGLPNSKFPAGLAVGSVVSAVWEKGQLDQTVTVRPFADLDRLTFVSVILWTAPPTVPMAIPTTVPVSVLPGEPASNSGGATTTSVDPNGESITSVGLAEIQP